MLCWEYVCTLSISSLYLVDKCWQDIIVDMSWNICYKLWVAALRRIRLPVTSLGLMARTPWKPGIPWLCRQWKLGFGVGWPRSVFWEAFHVCSCCLWLDGMTVFFERHIKIIKHIWISDYLWILRQTVEQVRLYLLLWDLDERISQNDQNLHLPWRQGTVVSHWISAWDCNTFLTKLLGTIGG